MKINSLPPKPFSSALVASPPAVAKAPSAVASPHSYQIEPAWNGLQRLISRSTLASQLAPVSNAIRQLMSDIDRLKQREAAYQTKESENSAVQANLAKAAEQSAELQRAVSVSL